MRQRALVAGATPELLKEDLLSQVFEYPMRVIEHEQFGHCLVLPARRNLEVVAAAVSFPDFVWLLCIR
jgi:hypothetical protein